MKKLFFNKNSIISLGIRIGAFEVDEIKLRYASPDGKYTMVWKINAGRIRIILSEYYHTYDMKWW